MNKELENKMGAIMSEEQELVFDSFNLDDAMKIGTAMLGRAKQEGQQIAVRISLAGRVLFQASMDGCAADTDSFLMRKENTVYRFFKSTYAMGVQMEMMGMDFHSFFGVGTDYVTAPGGFPIHIKNVGVVGSICCGGMMPPGDHEYIVDAVREFLKKK